MATSVTIVWTAIPYGTYTAATISTAMAAAKVPLAPAGFLSGFLGGVTVTSDTNSAASGNGVRTVVLNISNATFQTRFGSNPTAPFKGYMTGIIAAAICSPVVLTSITAA